MGKQKQRTTEAKAFEDAVGAVVSSSLELRSLIKGATISVRETKSGRKISALLSNKAGDVLIDIVPRTVRQQSKFARVFFAYDAWKASLKKGRNAAPKKPAARKKTRKDAVQVIQRLRTNVERAIIESIDANDSSKFPTYQLIDEIRRYARFDHSEAPPTDSEISAGIRRLRRRNVIKYGPLGWTVIDGNAADAILRKTTDEGAKTLT